MEEHLTALIADLIKAGNWQRGGGQGPQPKPFPRPEDLRIKDEKDKRAQAQAEAFLRRQQRKNS